MVRVASVSVEEQASYWRRRFDEWPDERLVRWVEGVARLKLRALDEKEGRVTYPETHR